MVKPYSASDDLTILWGIVLTGARRVVFVASCPFSSAVRLKFVCLALPTDSRVLVRLKNILARFGMFLFFTRYVWHFDSLCFRTFWSILKRCASMGLLEINWTLANNQYRIFLRFIQASNNESRPWITKCEPRNKLRKSPQ